MNKNELMNKVSRTIGKASFVIKKHSPAILVTAGVIGTVVSTVMACKATLKAGDILDETSSEMDKIKKTAEVAPDKYSEKDQQKETLIVYSQTALKMAKLYAPSVALGTVSISAIIWSHNILTKRNVALVAAYTAVDKGFKEYRNRVVERFGSDVDRELRYNIEAKELTKTIVNEDGTEEEITEIVEVAKNNEWSIYAKLFDECNSNWTKDPEENLYFLKTQQNYLNDKLKSRGHMFLNEVYDSIGIPRTKAGAVVGWIYDEKCPNGDNYIDFGLSDFSKEKVRDFINGYERSILLDFNVDGVILNQL